MLITKEHIPLPGISRHAVPYKVRKAIIERLTRAGHPKGMQARLAREYGIHPVTVSRIVSEYRRRLAADLKGRGAS